MFHRPCDVQGRARWLYFGRGGGVGIFGGVLCFYDGYVFIIMSNIGLCVSVCHSFVTFVYLNYVCGIFQVYSVIGLSFQCVLFLMSGLLCYMCVLCRVYVGRIWVLFVCFYGLDMLFISDFKCTYIFLHLRWFQIKWTFCLRTDVPIWLSTFHQNNNPTDL
jgi:hypothetical protein